MGSQQQPKLCRLTSISLVLFALLIALKQLASADSASTSSATSDLEGSEANMNSNPKRQYLIAPRIGRSGNQAIWSALEEATMNLPGQIQANRGYPSPLRSSLLYLVGNRRLIGPRSGSGLLPQARIGRRSSPMGLMPQPRVGRRSDGVQENDLGQQEVAVSTLSDTSLDDAIESLFNN